MFTRQKAGTLNFDRYLHGAIFDGANFLIIGGDVVLRKSWPMEVCSLQGITLSCTEQSTALEGDLSYPELFLVGQDFGKDKTRC